MPNNPPSRPEHWRIRALRPGRFFTLLDNIAPVRYTNHYPGVHSAAGAAFKALKSKKPAQHELSGLF